MKRSWLGLVALAAAPAMAVDEPPARIVVTGTASVSTPPDVAIVAYSIHGEGATSDDALRMLVAKRRAIDGGLATLKGTQPSKGGQVSIREVRSRECSQSSYGAPQLSTGACAIIGYAADLSLQSRTAAVRDAATMAGLIGRLGGTDPRVQSFSLADDAPAKRRATAAALADAKDKADAIAAGAGVRLGAVLSASDGSYGGQANDGVVAEDLAGFAPGAPPPPPPPVPVTITPQPIDTQARVIVTYRIAS